MLALVDVSSSHDPPWPWPVRGRVRCVRCPTLSTRSKSNFCHFRKPVATSVALQTHSIWSLGTIDNIPDRFITCLYTVPGWRHREISRIFSRPARSPARGGRTRTRAADPNMRRHGSARARGDPPHPPGQPRAAGGRPGASRGSRRPRSRHAPPAPGGPYRANPGVTRDDRARGPDGRRRGADARGARPPARLRAPSAAAPAACRWPVRPPTAAQLPPRERPSGPPAGDRRRRGGGSHACGSERGAACQSWAV
jgi:hypothetical protein